MANPNNPNPQATDGSRPTNQPQSTTRVGGVAGPRPGTQTPAGMQPPNLGTIYTYWDNGQPIETTGAPPSAQQHEENVVAAMGNNHPSLTNPEGIVTLWHSKDGVQGQRVIGFKGQEQTQFERSWVSQWRRNSGADVPV